MSRYDTAVLALTPLAYWPMGDVVGASALSDISGNAKPLSLAGSYTLQSGGPSPDERSWGLAGSGSASRAGVMTGLTSFSVCSLVYMGDSSANRVIWEESTATFSNGTLFLLNNTSRTVYCEVQNSNVTKANVSSSIAVALNTWSFVAATYDGSNIRLYVDGTASGVVAYTGGVTWGGSSRAGAPQSSTFVSPFNGRLAGLGLFSSVLSQTSITALSTAFQARGVVY